MKKSTALIWSGLFLALFFEVLAAVKFVDVAAIGPCGTAIGLSALNAAFHQLTGVNQTLYDLTQLAGLVAIGSGGAAGLVALRQFIRRKRFFAVDRVYFAFGGLCALIGILYALFEKIVINCRPVLMTGETLPEASFPSSHTLLTIAVFGALAMLIDEQTKRYTLKKSVCTLLSVCKLAAICLAIFAAIGRLLCGIHWLTDIAASLFLSASILFAYYAAMKEKNT